MAVVPPILLIGNMPLLAAGIPLRPRERAGRMPMDMVPGMEAMPELMPGRKLAMSQGEEEEEEARKSKMEAKKEGEKKLFSLLESLLLSGTDPIDMAIPEVLLHVDQKKGKRRKIRPQFSALLYHEPASTACDTRAEAGHGH